MEPVSLGLQKQTILVRSVAKTFQDVVKMCPDLQSSSAGN